MDLGLKGKKLIIGGATRGISRAVVELFAAEGADIAMFSRKPDELKTLAAELGKHGGKIVAKPYTWENRDGYKAILAELAEELGGVDVFIHSISSSGNAATQDWQQSFDLDMMGAVDGCETLQQHLTASKGSVILMSSTAAVETFLMPQAFNAIKAAIITYGKQLSEAWAPAGIRINMVSPGPITYPGGNWDYIKANMAEFYDSIVAQMPLGRLGNPDEVAKAIAFLASPAASYITGVNLIIDGGFTKRVQF